MPEYGDPTYWDDRYAKNAGSMFDWLEDYNSLKAILSQYLKPEYKILVIGCGNANFSEDLYDAGFPHIYNIDISKVVINQMKKRNAHRKLMKWEFMDCCKLTYPDNFFDIAIDKSTIDALLCGDNSYVITALMLKESQRVIKENGGIYLAISYGKPETRSMHFQRKFLSWTLKEYVLTMANHKDEEEQKVKEDKQEQEEEDKTHYIYVCTKANRNWREIHNQHFEKEIVDLIIKEKNQNLKLAEE